MTPASSGATAFHSLAWLGFLLACSSVFLTSDCISSERREGTLGLLFLTSLRGYDIVLGKLAAVGLSAFYGLLGFMPVLALTILHGGITASELARTALALLNTLWVCLAGGLWVSTRARAQHQANRNGLLLVAGLMVAPLLILHNSIRIVALASPFTAFGLAPGWVYAITPNQFWLALAFTQLEAWLLLVGAIRNLLRNWREAEDVARIKPQRRLTRSLERGGDGSSPQRSVLFGKRPGTSRPRPFLEPALIGREPTRPKMDNSPLPRGLARYVNKHLREDPIRWAVSRAKGRIALLAAGSLLMVGQGVFFMPFTYWLAGARGPLGSLNIFFSGGAGALLAWAAGSYFYEAKRSGELELLVSTPLGARDIIAGYWRAVWRSLRGMWLLMAFLILLEFLMMPALYRFRRGPPGFGLMILRSGLHPVVAALDVIALCWVGMWFGLRARKPVLVAAWTVGLVIGLPWVISYVLMICLSLEGGFAFRTTFSPMYVLYLGGMPLFDIAKNVFLIRWASQKLKTELRVAAPLAVGEWFR
jgi:hypothetical protein